MISAVSSMATALYVLRQNDDKNGSERSGVDAILSILNDKPDVAEARTAGSARPIVADESGTEEPKAEKISIKKPFTYRVFGDPLYNRADLTHGYGATYCVDMPDEIRDAPWFARQRGEIMYGSEAIIAPEKARHPSRPSFASNVVVATTLTQAEDTAWSDQVKAAKDLAASWVAEAISRNTQYHLIEQKDISAGSDDIEHDVHLNNRMQSHNFCVSGGMSGGYFDDRTFNQRVTFKDTGEVDLKPFQLKSDDGKVLVEMTENGHLLTYNRDGSVNEEYNRAQTGYLAAEKTSYAEYICLAAYTMDDEELDFY